MNTEEIVNYLDSVDPIIGLHGKLQLGKLLTETHSRQYRHLTSLCRSIIGQQLSVKAATTIWSRASLVILDWEVPELILSANPDELRAAGLSWQKISYIQNIARAVLRGELKIAKMDELTDDEIIHQLTRIKGIGKWTAEMFIMFSLGRPDVFSMGDLGLRNAIKKIYNLDSVSPAEAAKIAEKWSPYRTTACRILWLTLDNSPDQPVIPSTQSATLSGTGITDNLECATSLKSENSGTDLN
jgi:DNA-3-methyladenine glycosylase II